MGGRNKDPGGKSHFSRLGRKPPGWLVSAGGVGERKRFPAGGKLRMGDPGPKEWEFLKIQGVVRCRSIKESD